MNVTIALGGDTMLGRSVADALAERPPVDVWSAEVRAVFAEADAAIVNLECCISERGEPWDPTRKPFHFRAPPRAVEALAAIGVGAVWLANNHALDFGPEALLDTLEHLDAAGIVAVGAGARLAEARAGQVLEIGGARIGLVAFADHPLDFAAQPDAPGIALADINDGAPAWLEEEVWRLATTCDLVIAGAHWGPNMEAAPPRRHRTVAQELVDVGLSVLAGSSAHLVHGIERLGRGLICYDLGDLLDDYQIDPTLRNDLGMLALLHLGERLELVPLKLEYTHTTLARGADLEEIVTRVTAASRRFGTELRRESDRLVLDLGVDVGASASAEHVGV